MKKVIICAVLLVLSVMMLFGLTGCEQATAVNIVIVDGNGRANSPTFSYMLPAVDNLLNRAAHYGYVGQIIVEGVPRETASFSIPDLSTEGYTQQTQDDIARSYQTTITSTLQSASVLTEEADVLNAVQLGARSLQAIKSEDSENWLIIMDSMLGTDGVLDFTAGDLLGAAPEMIVDALCSKGEIVDLTDICVVVFGCGDTIAPQQPLNAQSRANLKAIWEAIFRAGNAKSIEFRDDLPTDTEINTLLPKVSTISVITEKVIPPDEPAETAAPASVIVRLGDATVSFVADEAIFRNPDAARSAILPFAEDLLAHPEKTVLIAGSTATAGTREGCLTLSRDRSSAVGELLLEAGVKPEQIICIGVGQESHSLRVPDTTADGRLVEAEAQKNRCVYIIELPSDKADELMRINS